MIKEVIKTYPSISRETVREKSREFPGREILGRNTSRKVHWKRDETENVITFEWATQPRFVQNHERPRVNS